ncbi:MAG TPA: hypothetical protein VMV21_14505 [Vicinamibacteria bacterium]|nr:hypothetical protein [Vicinamibacteria bacterium]
MGARLVLSVLLFAALAGCGGNDGTTNPEESPGWQAAQTLGTTEYLGTLAGDGNGNAVLAWIPPPLQDQGASIAARRFAPTTGWGPTQTLAPAGPNIFQSPVAAMDPRGGTFAVWPAVGGLLAAQSVASAWEPPQLISAESTAFHGLPAVGVSGPGAAVAVWTGGSGSSNALSANRLDSSRGWVSPETVWGIGARSVSEPALAVASSGFAIVAWAEELGDGARLWWTTYDPRRGWAVSQLVGLAGDTRLIYGVRAAVNATSEGVLVWTQDDTVFASHYTPVEGPGVPEPIGRGGCQGLAIDANGNALALLNQPLVPGAGLVLRVYRPGTGWAASPTVVAEQAGGAGALSMDARGNAWVVWADQGAVRARPYVSGQGLLATLPIAAAGSALLPQVVAEADGGAMAVWQSHNPDSSVASILSSRYVPR